MARSPDYDFLKRTRSLDQQLGGEGSPPPDVTRTQIVQLSSWASSRERAPQAQHWATMAAPGAGVHNGIRIYGTDLAAPFQNAIVMAHRLGINGAGNNCYMFLAAPASITLASDTEVTAPVVRDVDSEVTPRVNQITIAAASLPAAGAGVLDILPGAGFAGSNNAITLPWAVMWPDGNTRSLFIIATTADAIWRYILSWQAVRA